MGRASTLTRSGELTLDDLPEKIRVVPLAESERLHVLGTLKLLDGNQTLAAELLGLERRTLYRRLKEYTAAGYT